MFYTGMLSHHKMLFFVSLIKLATLGGAMIPWSRFGGSHPVVAQALMNQFVDIYVYIYIIWVDFWAKLKLSGSAVWLVPKYPPQKKSKQTIILPIRLQLGEEREPGNRLPSPKN